MSFLCFIFLSEVWKFHLDLYIESASFKLNLCVLNVLVLACECAYIPVYIYIL